MAKKGLSYGPSTALIEGAAAIGKSKLPTEMKGLQAITMMGSQMIEKDRARTAEARENIENTIAKVLADGGTLSDQHFSFATKEAQQYKEEYMRGVAMNNSDGNILKTKALNNLQKLSNSSNEEVELRKNLAKLKEDNLLTDNLDIATFEAYLNNDYVLRYEDGKKIYKIDNEDYTYEDIKKFEKDVKNPALTDANFKQINNLPAYIISNPEKNTKTFNDRAFNDMMLNSISTDERGFSNQMKDTTIGGQSIENVILNASGDILTGLENEFLVGTELIDMNGDNIKDDTDKALMIRDAILNPKNAAFNLDNSRKIIADLLTADARNKASKDGLLYVKPEKTKVVKSDKGGLKNKNMPFSIKLDPDRDDSFVKVNTDVLGIKNYQAGLESLYNAAYGTRTDGGKFVNLKVSEEIFEIEGVKISFFPSKFGQGDEDEYFQLRDAEGNPKGKKYKSIFALFNAMNIPTQYINQKMPGFTSAADF